MNTVFCPVRGEQIDGTTCLEICLVADNMVKERILDDYDPIIPWNEEQRQKCLNCKWHTDVEED